MMKGKTRNGFRGSRVDGLAVVPYVRPVSDLTVTDGCSHYYARYVFVNNNR